MKEILDSTLNLGRLKEKIENEFNIVYFKRGLDELSLNITNRCPNRCLFCIRDHSSGWNGSNLYLNNEPTNEQIVNEAIIQINKNNCKITKIKICGYGEPGLRISDIPTIIKGINSKINIPIWQLTTTGWPILLIKDYLKHLEESKKAGLTNIYLSLHSLNTKDYARIVRPSIDSKLAFNNSINFIKECVNLGFKVTISFLDIMKTDIKEIKKFTSNLNCKYEVRKYDE